VEHREVVEGDLHGILVLPDGEEQVPGVVVLGGSVGGLPEELTIRVAEQGFACLGVAYFGADGLKPTLVEIPVELVEHALHWLVQHPRARGERVGLLGVSKGAELALLTATLVPDLVGAVVAVVPSSVVFAGVDFSGGDGMTRSSWTWRDKAVPFVPYDLAVSPEFSERGMRTRPVYDAALAKWSRSEPGGIAVENIGGPILLLTGADDQMWPSAEMGSALHDRAMENDSDAKVDHVVYPGAGHLLLGFGPIDPQPGAPPPFFDFGGTPEGARSAAADTWPRISSFLHGALDV
jgi:dienelactone hydrolase